jgi:hypothetical protein
VARCSSLALAAARRAVRDVGARDAGGLKSLQGPPIMVLALVGALVKLHLTREIDLKHHPELVHL